ncbi:hypothetical protein DYU11_11525 [Fibrisoma montanum]|uniref:Uncharacterized protein n=1 Tax=Fibrisoma montanum TaxID=2305895 RepID=A0A418MB73_9BACT|nr:hypothetical protein [Fibrisoma montanum]RIV23604.1 hypothetical protein DYU11_11525 [Fibrisoma montanum]
MEPQSNLKLIRVAARWYVLVDVLTAGILVLAGYSWNEHTYMGVTFLVLYAMCKKFLERSEPIRETTPPAETPTERV